MSDQQSTTAVPRAFAIAVGGAGLIVLMAGMRASASLLGPTFLAVVITITTRPIRVGLESRRTPRGLAIMITLLVTFGALFALILALLLATNDFADLLPAYQDRLAVLVSRGRTVLASLGIESDRITSYVSRLNLGELAGAVGNLVTGFANVASGLILLAALLLFMGIDAPGLSDRMRAGSFAQPRIINAMAGFASATRSYVLVATVFGLLVAILDTGVLALVGIPLPLLWGLLSFLTNYIPNIGFVIGLSPPAVLALLEGGIRSFAVVVILYVAINFVLQSLIQPKIVGDSLNLSLTVTFISVVFWGWLLGGLGALLAVPLTLFAKAVLVDSDPDAQWVGALLSSPNKKTGSAPDAPVLERAYE